MKFIDDIEFPTPICSDAMPHAKHRIPGTWRDGCLGVQGPEVQHNATGDYSCTECGHQGRGQVPGCTCIGCDDDVSVRFVDPTSAPQWAARFAFRPYHFDAPSKVAEEKIACPGCGAQAGEKCRWPDGGTCTTRVQALGMQHNATDDVHLAYAGDPGALCRPGAVGRAASRAC